MRPGDFRETDEREDWGIMQENREKKMIMCAKRWRWETEGMSRAG
jgi:hypothetical protein